MIVIKIKSIIYFYLFIFIFFLFKYFIIIYTMDKKYDYVTMNYDNSNLVKY